MLEDLKEEKAKYFQIFNLEGFKKMLSKDVPEKLRKQVFESADFEGFFGVKVILRDFVKTIA